MKEEHTGTRLRKKMLDFGVDHAEVAKACEVSRTSVYSWLRSGYIDKKHYPALIKMFGETVEWWAYGMESGSFDHTDKGSFVSRDRAIETVVNMVRAQISAIADTLKLSSEDVVQIITDRESARASLAGKLFGSAVAVVGEEEAQPTTSTTGVRDELVVAREAGAEQHQVHIDTLRANAKRKGGIRASRSG